MPDVLKLLPPFEWRGRKYPVTGRSVSFSQDGVAHVLQYRDFEVMEPTGARDLIFRYTVPMRQDIARGPYSNLFTEGLPVLFRDMLTRSNGPLVDPVHGQFTCVPRSYDEDADPNKRDGVDVKIEFKRDTQVDEDQSLTPPTLQDVESEAAALDADIKLADWHQEPPPEGTTDIFSAINGILFTGQRAIDKVSGLMNDVAFRCEKIENTVDRETDPKLWPIRRDARRLREAASRGAELTNPNRLVKVVVGIQKTLSAVALEFGLTVDALIKNNPALASSPFVPAGTKIRVPARG